MTDFEKLHPALQHHIVNSLGWRDLRPLQERCIAPVMGGSNVLLLAPTAGGKTEAAVFPLLSQMVTEEWPGLSVVYLCPIKALLNNLSFRLETYTGFVGRRSAFWHGDVSNSERLKIVAEPPHCLLTTPESLQVLLVSKRVDQRLFFANLRCIVVDELHAFGGDDRGWHLLAVVELLAKLLGRDLQRLGLSATVGNGPNLLEWLSGTSDRSRVIVAPEKPTERLVDAQLDFVGHIENAALVISRLHQGEKRLVFCDSRSRVERLATELIGHEVDTYVSHSSLSADERRRTETAFREGRNCVIAATSTLELGIDVGDLDRVLQIDSPLTVSSFLQRLGRTGRRPNTVANCLFLATQDNALLQAAAVLRLWRQGFVEAVLPPTWPYHVLVQQILCLILQKGALTRSDILAGLAGFCERAAFDREDLAALLEELLQTQILFEEAGVLSLGEQAEKLYGAKNFMNLFSVFDTAPLFTVRCGRDELGTVPDFIFWHQPPEFQVLSLGGKSWQVNAVDWKKKLVYVEPTREQGSTIWAGQGRWLSFELSREMRAILVTDENDACWSKRAVAKITELRANYKWLSSSGTSLLAKASTSVWEWWTFAGGRINSVLAAALETKLGVETSSTNYVVLIKSAVPANDLIAAIRAISQQPVTQFELSINPELIESIKFHQALSHPWLAKMLRARLVDPVKIQEVCREAVQIVGKN